MSGHTETRKLWDEALQRLLNLSSLTVNRNAELVARVAELERENQLWKSTHAAALEEVDRQAKVHQLQVSALNKQMAGIELFRDQDPFVFCVINGDKTFFSDYLLSQGSVGGRLAAQTLTQAIADRLAGEDVQCFSRLSYWVYLYINKSGMRESLLQRGICTRDQYEGFLLGFSQASSRFSLIDVGQGMEGADVKIKEYVQTFAKFPQTLKIFLTGGDEPGYTNLFGTLEEQDLLGKLVMMHDPATVSPQTSFTLPRLNVEGVFVVPSRTASPRPSLPVGHHPNVTTNGGLISPKSPSQQSPLRTIDPLLPLHKQAPPPCNEHYLMTCSKGPGACKYSHEYVLTPEQLASLAQNAKKAPCNWLKNGLTCPYGDHCCWGHICPNGPGCYHKSKGKCWFKNMHA